jgi:hypothetical protein
MTEMFVFIEANGDLKFIYCDEVSIAFEESPQSSPRASFVEPTSDGQWTADMSPVNGPVLGPFKLRGDALKAETEWLLNEMMTRRVDVNAA